MENDSLTLSAAASGHLMGCKLPPPPWGGDKEPALCITLILHIPLSFPVGSKDLWTHQSVVCTKPLLAEEKRELRWISAIGHVLTGSHRKCDLTVMNLRAPPPLTGQTRPLDVLPSCASLPQWCNVAILLSWQPTHRPVENEDIPLIS